MPYRELTLDPPFAVLAGDRFPVDRSTSTIYQIRGTAIVDSRVVSFPGALIGETPAAESDGVFGRILIWEEHRMPGVTISITKIRRGTAEQVYVDFSNGDQLPFETLADVASVADEVDASVTIAQKILIMKMIRESPDGAKLGAAEGSQVSINGSAGVTEPVVYTAAQ